MRERNKPVAVAVEDLHLSLDLVAARAEFVAEVGMARRNWMELPAVGLASAAAEIHIQAPEE